jgi:Flp pilus assembly protein TadB
MYLSRRWVLPATATRRSSSEKSRDAPVSQRQSPERKLMRETEASIRLVDPPRGAGGRNERGYMMLWTISGALVFLWLLAFVGHVGGSLIHLLLLTAVILLWVNFRTGRRTV